MADLSLPIEHFRKQSKNLLKRVEAGDSTALERVQAVFKDANAGETKFGLMRAQHVVAVEHGFKGWSELANASPIEARLAITMARLPELNDFGMGLFGGHYEKSKAEQQAIYGENRRVLRAEGSRVEATVTWLLENVKPTEMINRRHTSYGLKHLAEKDIGYITNGVFIAAGIIAGYPYEIIPGCPNVPFGMSEKSLREISTRRHAPERVLKRFTPSAIRILRARGLRVFPRGRAGNEIVWLEDGDVRTLKMEAIETKPFIVRLFVDHYRMLVSRKIAKELRIPVNFRYETVTPTRPKGEISLLPDEVEAALEWALTYDARGDEPPPPAPFRRHVPQRASGLDAWSYVWSARAWARNSAVNSETVTRAFEEASVGRLLHDETEADDDGFVAGAGFDRYGGFPGDGLS